MILPIVKYGASILRKKAFEIDKGDDFQNLANNMMATLKQSEGIGLAGPQVACAKNIFIIDTTPLAADGVAPIEKVYINPEILHFGDHPVYYNEGCLSIPDIYEDVLRPDSIMVRYRDINFDLREETLNDIVARIFQHEYGHLQGILFVDRINGIRKRLLRGKLRRIERSSFR